MLNTRLFLFTFALSFFGITITADSQHRPSFLDDSVEYIWPTNASYYMSSGFGETRSAHFHAALDIGTWGRTGYRIYATRDGILHRVGIGPRGYGNVIYLKHHDGSYSLYAHLKDFVPEIRSVVDSLRFQNYSFTFDEVLEDYNIRFNQGDLIGISGDTGIGPPHLHFELRTPEGLPFNPLLTNISVPDNIPPQFVSLSVEPLSADALVEGRKHITQRRVARSGQRNHFGTIAVTGTVGLGIDVFDQADNANNVYAVYDLKLMINDELYFHSRIDSFSYDDTHQMFLDRVYPILRESRRGFQRLFVKGANRLPFYADTGQSGAIRLPPGRHYFEIIASDFFGNTSRADGFLQFEDQEPMANNKNRTNTSLPLPYTSSSPSLELADWYWNNNWVAPYDRPAEELIVRIHTPGTFLAEVNEINLTRPNQAIDVSGDHSKIITVNDAGPYMLHRVHPDRKSEFYSLDQRASVSFVRGSVYDTMSVGLNYNIGKNGLPEIRLYPEHQPINEKATINFVLDKELAQKDNLSFYYKHPRRDSYEIVDSYRDGAVLSGEIGHFDTFYVLEDSLGPEISNPRMYTRRDGKWEISVTAKDDLSGIDYHASEFYWNDVRGIAEYDPENDLLRYHHPHFKPEAENRIRVIVSDRAGNVTYQNFDVRK